MDDSYSQGYASSQKGYDRSQIWRIGITSQDLTSNNLNNQLGAQIANLRKAKGISKSELGQAMVSNRPQAWISSIESGRQAIKMVDLAQIADALGTNILEIISSLRDQSIRDEERLSDIVKGLIGRLPIEVPLFRQSDFDDPAPKPVDYEYGSFTTVGTEVLQGSLNRDFLRNDLTTAALVVEKSYLTPRLDPTDILTFSTTVAPHTDDNIIVTDRVIAKLNQAIDGIKTHPGIIVPSGNFEMQITGHEKISLKPSDYDIVGVLIVRRTLYPTSLRRDWLHRKFGITKDETYGLESV